MRHDVTFPLYVKVMKRSLRFLHRMFIALLFDPVEIIRKWRGIPYYLRNAIAYRKLNQDPKYRLSVKHLHPVLHDRFVSAGAARGHYFFQDIWAARSIYSKNIKQHVDVGSRLDGFVAHLLPFSRVTYIDIRPLDANIAGLEVKQGSVTDMPFPDNSVISLSCLHVIEHIGLGRYGDQIDPDGYIKAAKELSRVLAPGGMLLVGVPVGKERLCFDAHRVFDPQTIVGIFEGLSLKSFSLIDDNGDGIRSDASFQQGVQCNYGCGLFEFEK